MSETQPPRWDLDSSAQDLIRALAAAGEGFCPDCLSPLGEFGWCQGCGAGWQVGHAAGGELWLLYRSPHWIREFVWYPYQQPCRR